MFLSFLGFLPENVHGPCLTKMVLPGETDCKRTILDWSVEVHRVLLLVEEGNQEEGEGDFVSLMRIYIYLVWLCACTIWR